MQLPDQSVRKAVVSLLTAASLPVFDSSARVDVKPPYLLLLNQDNVEFSTKSSYGFLHSLTLSAVDSTRTPTGRERAENLLNQAIGLLTADKPGDPVKIDLSGSAFRCWMVRLQKPKDLVFTGDSESVYQKIITLEFSIEPR